MDPKEIAINWLIFIGQIAAGVLLIILFIKLYRLIRALVKRASAMRRLKKYCAENKLGFKKIKNVWGSVFRLSGCPELIIDSGRKRYVIKFLTTIKRNMALHFMSDGLYRYSKLAGFSIPINLHWVNSAHLYKPENMGSNLFTYYLGEFFEIPNMVHRMPDIKFNDYEKPGVEIVPVLLLNPLPMKITGVVANGSVMLAGGDFFEKFMLHSASSLIADFDRERIFGDLPRKKILGLE
jgi:hypothetical protein